MKVMIKKISLGIVFALFTLSSAMAGVVNINKADAAALQQNLAGIGAVKAKAIVDYRKKNGPFKSVNDLALVPGIGEKTVKKNAKNLSLSKGAVKQQAVSKAKKTAETANKKVASKAKKEKATTSSTKSAKANLNSKTKDAKDKMKAKVEKAKQ